MKHLKIYENYIPSEYDVNLEKLKILLKHFRIVLEEFGFNYRNYVDGHTYEIEFDDQNDDYVFYLNMKIDSFQKNNIILQFKKSLAHKNNIVTFITEYLKNINGIKFISYDNSHTYTYYINIKDVDKLINQISVNDINFKLNANNYNI
jgi:hypothetical protein